MKAIVYNEYGSPDNLRYEEVQQPVPKDDEVLVKIHAASINSWDWDMIIGKPLLVRAITGFFKPRKPIIGSDIAGVVAATGKNVTDFKTGDEVFGDISGHGFGAFAEYVCVPAGALAKKSEVLSFEQSAALPQAGLLAIQGLRNAGRIKQGDKVLINGAGGSVGTLALQYAKSIGAIVTCVDIGHKLQFLQVLGADHVIDYTQDDYTRNGIQYDIILDVIAHRSVADYKRALAPHGRFVMLGGSMGGLLFQMMAVQPALNKFRNKELGIMGFRPNRGDLELLDQLCKQGILNPVTDSTFPLAKTADAFRHFGSGLFKGKIIITMERNNSR